MHAKAILRSHWSGLFLLVPFLAMLAVHRVLGLSDALMIQTPPGEREARTYNLIMAVVLHLGVVSFVVHTFVLAPRTGVWMIAKLAALLVYWIAILEFHL